MATLPGLAGAAITLHHGPLQQPLAATDTWTAELEQLQYTLGEGPSITAYTDRLPVLVGEVGAELGRWPAYAAPAAGTGVTGVWAFPLCAAAAPLGTLTLYRRETTPIGASEAVDAAVLADLAGVALLADQDRIAAELLDPREAAGSFSDVSIAVGIVTVQLGLAATDALSALRARAFATGRTITHLAREIVRGRIRLD